MSSDLVWEGTLTRERIEYAYGLAKKMQQQRNHGWAEIGMRAARSRDPKMMIALERMAETTGQMEEEQVGRLKRSPDATHGETRGTTEHQMCREAFRLADEGNPIENLMWIYGSAAWLCGYNL